MTPSKLVQSGRSVRASLFSVLAIALVSVFAVPASALAAHTATVTVDPVLVKGGSSGTTYSFTVANDAGSTNPIYYVKITAPTGFSISDALVCPTGWAPTASGSYVICLGDADPSTGLNIAAGTQTEISFSATAPAADSVDPWVVLTKDNGFISQNYNPVTSVDNTPPTTTDDLGDYLGGWTNLDVTVTLDSVDSGSSVSSIVYSTDGSAPSISYTGAFVLSTSGTYTLKYAATDAVGNIEATVTGSAVQIDKAAPVTIGAVGAPKFGSNPVYITSSTAISLSADDGSGSGIDSSYYVIDNAEPATYSGTPFTIVDAGAHSVSFGSTDAVGNQEVAQTLSVFVDDSDPVVGAISVSPISGAFISGSSNISASITDAESGVASCEYTLDGATWVTANLSEGTCSVTGVDTALATSINMRGTDNVGNIGSGTAIPVTPDTNAPTISVPEIMPISPTNNNSPQVTFTVADGGSGVAAESIKVSIGATDYTPTCTDGACSYDFSGLSDGTYAFAISATDNVGNVASDDSLSGYIIDIQDPTTSDDYSAKNDIWQGATQIITLTPADAGLSGVEWTKYCTDAADACDPATAGTEYTAPVTLLDEGTTYFRYASGDFAGNVQSTVSRIVKIDTIVPASVSLTAPTAGSYNKGVVTLTADAADNIGGSGIAKVEFYAGADKIGEDTTAPFSYSWDTAALTADYSLTVVATDSAGKSTTSNAVIIHVDNTAPAFGGDYLLTGGYPMTADQMAFSEVGNVAMRSVSIDVVFSESVDYTIVIKDSSSEVIESWAGTNVTDPQAKVWDGTGNTGDGIYTIEISAEDAAGNTFSDTSKSILLDNSAPTVNAGPDDTTNTTTTTSASASDVGSDIAAYAWSGAGLTFEPADTLNTDISALTDGTYTATLTVTDNVGNSNSDTMQYVLDTEDPTATITSPGSDAVAKAIGGEVDLVFTATGGAMCEYSTNGGTTYQTLASCASPQSLALTDGRNALTLRVTDAAGNDAVSVPVLFVVDTNNTLTVGASGADFTTVQEAITKATAGDTINIAAGTYAESLTVGKDVSVVGSGATTVISPATDQNGFLVTADGVTIQNLKITLQTSGVDAQAIRLEGANSVTISGNTIETTGDKGIGIWIGGYGYANSDDLTVTGNTIVINNASTGIYAEGGSIAQSGWQITNNTITANNGNPIELYDVTDSTVSGNTLTTTLAGGSNVMWFSELSDLANLVFSNNILSGSSGSEVAIGTDFRNDGPFLDSPATTITTVTVSGNTFSDWGSRALRIGHFGAGTVSGVTVSNNKFLVGTQTTTLTNTDASIVNAEGNWWGAAGGPVASTIVGNVDYRPWYRNAELTGLDSESPTPTITSAAGSLTNASPIPMAVNFGESVTGLDSSDVVISNGSTGNFSGSGTSYTFDVTPTADGAITVDIAASVAEDASGNFSNAATQFSITYDSTAPTATVSGVPSGLTNVTSTDITVGGTGVVAYKYKLDGGTYSETEIPVATHLTLSGLTGGEHNLYVIGRDDAGNWQVEPSTANVTWTVDTSAPVAALTGAPANPTNATTATVTVGGTGVVSYKYKVDSGSYSAESLIATTIDLSGLTAGAHTLSVIGKDEAGNWQAEADATTHSWTIDTSAPSVSSKTPGASAVGIDPAADISVVFSEGVLITDAEVTLQKGTNPAVSTTVSGSGTQTVTIHPSTALDNNSTYTITLTGVTDMAGNALPETSWFFTTSASYSISLTNGWNLISLPVVPTNMAASSVLGALNDSAKVESVFKYDPVAGEWKVYHPGNPDTSSFSTMTAGEGYWVSYLSNSSGTIAGTGNLFQEGNSTPPQKTLAAGWNLIGYYQLENTVNTSATNALSTVAGQWTQLRTYSNIAKQFQAVTGGDLMKPGEGYWIFMKSSSYAPYLYGPGDTD